MRIEILYTGVCHSDLHMARNEWGNSIYPIVPGHEIVGRVTAVGENVTSFKKGDLAAVGCMVDSCQDCASCADGLEQYCEKGLTLTYNSKESDGTITYGGYSDSIVVTENFVLHVSDKLDLKATAPLLCAGITTYSPLRLWNCKPGDRVGVIADVCPGYETLGEYLEDRSYFGALVGRYANRIAGARFTRRPLMRRRSSSVEPSCSEAPS